MIVHLIFLLLMSEVFLAFLVRFKELLMVTLSFQFFLRLLRFFLHFTVSCEDSNLPKISSREV